MKNRIQNVIILLVAIFTSACVSTLPAQIQSQKRNTESFTKISLAISADVILTQSSQHSIEIEADAAILEKIETLVEGKSLIIKAKNGKNLNNPGKITIKISTPVIDGLTIAGAGTIDAPSNVNCENLNITIAGSGDVKLRSLRAKEIENTISGSGNIVLGGSADKTSITIAGSGNVKAKTMECNTVSVLIAGSGRTEVFANNTLNVEIAGSGDVLYKGEAVLNTKSFGSGSVKRLE